MLFCHSTKSLLLPHMHSPSSFESPNLWEITACPHWLRPHLPHLGMRPAHPSYLKRWSNSKHDKAHQKDNKQETEWTTYIRKYVTNKCRQATKKQQNTLKILLHGPILNLGQIWFWPRQIHVYRCGLNPDCFITSHWTRMHAQGMGCACSALK